MKRSIRMFLFGIGTGLAVLLVTGVTAMGGPGYSARDLNGEYVFTVASIAYEGGVLDYCDHAGTMSFDGVSTVTVTETRRCSSTGLISETAVLSYRVIAPTGEVLFEDPTAPLDPVHGQIAEKGRSILLDGTKMTNPRRLLFHGVAMQR